MLIEQGQHPEIVEALRREAVASAAVKHWTAQYRDNPTDANALSLHLAWCHMRESIDALVAMPSPIREMVALAASDGSQEGS